MIIAFGLAGCGSSNSFKIPGLSSTPNTQANKTVAQQKIQNRKIAIANVIGAPDAVNKQIIQQFTSSLASPGLTVVKTGDATADYVLRGYMVAAKERRGTKVSYIWDLNDKAGNKLKRISGENLAAKTKSRDPWSAVTPAVIKKIVTPVSPKLVALIPKTPVRATAQRVATTTPSAATNPAGATTTGSIASGKGPAAIVVPVKGAPGDGNIALTRAMRNALTRNGVAVRQNGAPSTYRVEGRVKLVGKAKNKRQPVQVVWTVRDAKGGNVGGLQQDNTMDVAILKGKWGAHAEDAASAAAQGIVKLLPGKK